MVNPKNNIPKNATPKNNPWIKRLFDGNVVFTAVVFVFAMGILLYAIPHGVDSGYDGVVLTPATVPTILAVALAVLAIIQFIWGVFLHPPQQHTLHDETFCDEMNSLSPSIIKRALGLFALVGGYLYALDIAGFLIATALLTAIILWLSHERAVSRYALGVVMIPVVIWYVVVHLLERPLP